jgi:hypothetical protein
MLEKPGPKDGDRPLGKSSLGPPRIVLDHPKLLKCPLLSELVINEAET